MDAPDRDRNCRAVITEKEKIHDGSARFADFHAGTDIVRLRVYTMRPYRNVIEKSRRIKCAAGHALRNFPLDKAWLSRVL